MVLFGFGFLSIALAIWWKFQIDISAARTRVGHGSVLIDTMFEAGFTWQGLGPTGGKVSIRGLTGLQPRLTLQLELTSADGKTRAVPVACRIDTLDELAYFQNGGILPYVLRRLAA